MSNLAASTFRFRSAYAFKQSDQNIDWMHFCIAKYAKFLHADNDDSDQTVQCFLM